MSLAADGAQGSGRGVGSSNFQDMPEWKKNILGGPKVSYGKNEKRSILEQRQVPSTVLCIQKSVLNLYFPNSVLSYLLFLSKYHGTLYNSEAAFPEHT